jgi:signal transduction histidine kinase
VVVGRALRPVESIRAEVAAISEADLGRRVPAPPGDDEIARLARTMNAMLDRLEQASVRQAAFTADASHELQSPLTTLRAQLEVALARPTDADWPAVGGELLDEVQEMERMVRDLLFLARASEGDERLDALVDLDDVVLEEAARARSTTSVQVLTSSVSAAPVRGSREQLLRLTRNLLENACRHASSTVDVSLAVVGSTVRLAIRDDGPGVPASARERIFERFVRVDDARSRQVAGTGLGLSIVAAVAARHGGSVRLLDGDGDGAGATFVLVLPADSGPI